MGSFEETNKAFCLTMCSQVPSPLIGWFILFPFFKGLLRHQVSITFMGQHKLYYLLFMKTRLDILLPTAKQHLQQTKEKILIFCYVCSMTVFRLVGRRRKNTKGYICGLSIKIQSAYGSHFGLKNCHSHYEDLF